MDAAALAERALGVGQDADSFAFVHVGTGIGMGLVLGGRLHRGVHGVAGEIAFLPLAGDQPTVDAAARPAPPRARRRGALETAAAPTDRPRGTRAGLRGPATARSVFAAAAAGDERAAAVVPSEARLVAAAICCVIAVVDPPLIVLGGGIGQAPGFAEAVTAALRARSPRCCPRCRVSALGTDVVVDGCLAEAHRLAWPQLTSTLLAVT